MKNIALFLLFCFIPTMTIFAQLKSQRRIYLWDVTLSMKGHGGTPNIYNDVIKFLEQEINSITDESSEIVVCPFQESILETWKAKADVSGKKNILKKIKGYTNSEITNTDIVKPIQQVQTSIIANDRRNLLILLTDGKQNESLSGGKAGLLRLIENWGEYADINDAYALYVMLTDMSIDQDIIGAIERTDNISVVKEPGAKEIIDLQPADVVKFNIKDDKTAKISLSFKSSIKLPDNIKIQITAEDSILTVNQTVVVKDDMIVFDVNFKKPYDILKIELPEITRIPLSIKLLNKNSIEQILYLTKEKLQLELINRPEKTLKISIKQ